MFNKYFELIKSLFETVFTSGGESVQFIDYLYVLGFTFALIAAAIISVIALYYMVKLPFIVYQKFVKKIKKEIEEVETAVADQDYSKYPKDTIANTYETLYKSLKKRRIGYIFGVVFVYVPFVIPTILFVISLVKSWL